MVVDFDTSGARPRRSARLLSTSTQTTQGHEIIAEGSVCKDTPVTRTRKRKQLGGSSSGDTSTGLQWKASVSGVLKSSVVEMDPAVETMQNDDNSGLADPASNYRKRRRYKPAAVYIIPEVQKKSTTFQGRLGYACLNTVLRNRKPATESIFCSRTCRLDSLRKNGIDFAKDLGRKNVEDLLTVIQWNEDNNIRLFRLSSEMFPYASHGTYGYTLEYCAELLAKAGALANKYGHRLTTHPGQFTQLGSPKPNVVEASVRELVYHCQMLDLMGMGPDSVMIIHGGGVYNDKPVTLRRLKQSIEDLPNNVRKRIVLENDEIYCLYAKNSMCLLYLIITTIFYFPLQ
ncbi:UV-endonuclease UvdE-domain-containing protein [Pholiota molesta]|nr:UV-endonuclease UvdE-domain-containing protein [Pholiota molesta]